MGVSVKGRVGSDSSKLASHKPKGASPAKESPKGEANTKGGTVKAGRPKKKS